jgi:hypothetical protein
MTRWFWWEVSSFSHSHLRGVWGCDRTLMARQIVPGALFLPLLSIATISLLGEAWVMGPR